MNKIFVHHRSSHHAVNSGYGRLVDFIEGQVVYGKTKFPYRLAKFLSSKHSQKAGIYNTSSIFKTIELYWVLKKYRNQKNMVHFLNGERDIRYLGFFKKSFPNTKFVATFHRPPEILEKNITDTRALRQLDGAIAVGANQVEFLKSWLRLEHVEYIPHGVDTEFFKPNAHIKKENTLLFVGQHLRDFKMFNKTIPQLLKKVKGLKVNVVLHPTCIFKIVSHPNVKVYSEVSDEELLGFYQKASLLFLPLRNSTACNSLLEAMACGLPIITSNVGGNFAYLEDTLNILIEKGKQEEFIRETMALLQDVNRLEAIGDSSKEKSLKLNWTKVSQDIKCLYCNVS